MTVKVLSCFVTVAVWVVIVVSQVYYSHSKHVFSNDTTELSQQVLVDFLRHYP